MNCSKADKTKRKEVVVRLAKLVKTCYPKAEVMVFGSCASGLNLPNSDIDLLVYLPEQKDISMINRLSLALMKSGMCKSLDPIKHARVPIIKL